MIGAGSVGFTCALTKDILAVPELVDPAGVEGCTSPIRQTAARPFVSDNHWRSSCPHGLEYPHGGRTIPAGAHDECRGGQQTDISFDEPFSLRGGPLARKVRQSELACILDEGIRILDFHQLATHGMRDPGTAKRPKVTRMFGPSLALEVRLSRIRMMIAPSYRKTRSSVAAWPGGAKPTEDRRRIVIAVEDDTPCKTTSEDTLGENAQTKRRKAVISRKQNDIRAIRRTRDLVRSKRILLLAFDDPLLGIFNPVSDVFRCPGKVNGCHLSGRLSATVRKVERICRCPLYLPDLVSTHWAAFSGSDILAA